MSSEEFDESTIELHEGRPADDAGAQAVQDEGSFEADKFSETLICA